MRRSQETLDIILFNLSVSHIHSPLAASVVIELVRQISWLTKRR